MTYTKYVQWKKKKTMFDVLRNLASNRTKPIYFCLFFWKLQDFQEPWVNSCDCILVMCFQYTAFPGFFFREHQFTFHAILVRVTSWGILHLGPQQWGCVCVCVCVCACVRVRACMCVWLVLTGTIRKNAFHGVFVSYCYYDKLPKT